MSVTLADLSDSIPDAERPRLDRSDLDAGGLSALQSLWREQGCVIREKLVPKNLIDAYCRTRENADWGYDATPYMQIPEIRDLCLYPPLAQLLEHLIGEPMGLHLNLASWFSSERDWHQDIYLNPAHVRGHYLAVWIALEDVNPDSGPFEYAPGSHRGGYLSNDKVIARLLGDGLMDASRVADGSWPHYSEKLLTRLGEEAIVANRWPVRQFLASKGDVLVWHCNLLHRGSRPRVPGTVRRALIGHYSGVHHRQDMPPAVRDSGGGYFFPLFGGTHASRSQM